MDAGVLVEVGAVADAPPRTEYTFCWACVNAMKSKRESANEMRCEVMICGVMWKERLALQMLKFEKSVFKICKKWPNTCLNVEL